MTKVTPTRETGLIRLIGKDRVLKSGPRIKLLSAIDEAASALGLAQASSSDAHLREILLHVQCDLYILMADVATPPHRLDSIGMTITPALVEWLEAMKAALLAEIDLPNTSIIPGGCMERGALDVAHLVIRRTERLAARLVKQRLATNPDILRYLNRLSDVIFILACAVEARQGGNMLPHG